jgi:hypothetical protein
LAQVVAVVLAAYLLDQQLKVRVRFPCQSEAEAAAQRLELAKAVTAATLPYSA